MDQVRSIVRNMEELASLEYVDNTEWQDMVIQWVEDIRTRVANLERDLRASPGSFCFTGEDVDYIKTNMPEFPNFVELVQSLIDTT